MYTSGQLRNRAIHTSPRFRQSPTWALPGPYKGSAQHPDWPLHRESSLDSPHLQAIGGRGRQGHRHSAAPAGDSPRPNPHRGTPGTGPGGAGARGRGRAQRGAFGEQATNAPWGRRGGARRGARAPEPHDRAIKVTAYSAGPPALSVRLVRLPLCLAGPAISALASVSRPLVTDPLPARGGAGPGRASLPVSRNAPLCPSLRY